MQANHLNYLKFFVLKYPNVQKESQLGGGDSVLFKLNK